VDFNIVCVLNLSFKNLIYYEMKKTTLPFMFIALMLLAGCAENGLVTDDMSIQSVMKSSIAKGNCGAVFTVLPNGTDDTESLKDAFADAIAAGPGSTVLLVEGTYYLGFIEIRDFFGSFCGSGKGKTIINFLSNMDCSAYTYVYDLINIRFIGGELFMSGMTLNSPTEKICSTGGWNKGGALAMVAISSASSKYNSGMFVKAVVSNVDFMGIKAGWRYSGYSYISGLLFGQCGTWQPLPYRMKGDVTVTGCTFDTFYQALAPVYLGDSRICVTDSYFNQSTYSIDMVDVINSDCEITGNKFDIWKGYWGIRVYNTYISQYTIYEPQTRRSTCSISHNDFNEYGGVFGIRILDQRRQRNEGMPYLTEIKNNSFNMSDDAMVGINLRGTVDAVVRNNRFTGTGTIAGINGDSFNNANGNLNTLVLGNNFSGFGPVDIVMNQLTNGWTVIGGGEHTEENVINLGTGNRISGMNLEDYDGALGQTIKDNLILWDSLTKDIDF